MKTLGIDLAVDPNDTGLCLLSWEGGGLSAHYPTSKTGEELLELITEHDGPVGIDAPFGWPKDFAEAVSGYLRPGGKWAANATSDQPWEDAYYRLRATDKYVKQVFKGQGVNPLSVTSDKIGATAMKAAWLLTRLAEREDVSRDGSIGRVYEAYPKAALARWGVKLKPYKRLSAAQRATSISEVKEQLAEALGVAVLDLGEMAHEHHVDAFVCALVARAAQLTADGEEAFTVTPKVAAQDKSVPNLQITARARIEGWIQLPTAEPVTRLIGTNRQ